MDYLQADNEMSLAGAQPVVELYGVWDGNFDFTTPPATISIPVWFVLEGEKLYLLPVQASDTP